MTETPFFSIIIPTYNRLSKIGATIDAALNQTLKDFEIIVIDDGSTDGTFETIQKQYPNVHIQRISNSERGAARNRGAEMAKGQYCYFLDSDDILYPNHLECAKQFIEQNQTPPWFFQEYVMRTGSSKKRVSYNPNTPFKTLIEKGNFMSCHGVFLRRDIARDFPFIEDRTLAGSEDYELWIRIGLQHNLITNPQVTSELVNHADRSVFNFEPELLIKRKMQFLAYVLNNEALKENTKTVRIIESNAYSYIALHIALTGKQPRQSLKWWLKSISKNPSTLLTKRSLAILKHILLKPKHG